MREVLLFMVFAGASLIRAEQFCMVGTSTTEPVYRQQICFNPQTNSFDISDVPQIVEDGAARDWRSPLDTLGHDIDVVWVLTASFLVFFMQCGFAMLEAGSVQEKNVLNILYKNIMEVSIASVAFFLVGYAFAYGDENDNAFIGTANFGLTDLELGTWHDWFFRFAFAATASTIVSGSVAERCKIYAYYAYSFFLIFIIYPVVVHWVWDDEGWLSAFNPNSVGTNGVLDFAGSGVCHMVGGLAGLVAAIILGPRTGRFNEKGEVQEFRPHSVTMQALGTLILWTGWYGFNCGSTLAAANGAADLAGRVAVTTTLSAGSAAIACALIGIIFLKDKCPSVVCNGILAGLVSITAGCATMTPGSAIAVGAIGGLIYYGFSRLLWKLQIDDPLDASAVHGVCGAWGTLAAGIFSQRDEIRDAYNFDNDAVASGEQFGVQLLGVTAVATWTMVTSAIMFWTIKKTIGFRVDQDVEHKGLDITEHGGTAYTRHWWPFHHKHVEMAQANPENGATFKTTPSDYSMSEQLAGSKMIEMDNVSLESGDPDSRGPTEESTTSNNLSIVPDENSISNLPVGADDKV